MLNKIKGLVLGALGIVVTSPLLLLGLVASGIGIAAVGTVVVMTVCITACNKAVLRITPSRPAAHLLAWVTGCIGKVVSTVRAFEYPSTDAFPLGNQLVGRLKLLPLLVSVTLLVLLELVQQAILRVSPYAETDMEVFGSLVEAWVYVAKALVYRWEH